MSSLSLYTLLHAFVTDEHMKPFVLQKEHIQTNKFFFFLQYDRCIKNTQRTQTHKKMPNKYTFLGSFTHFIANENENKSKMNYYSNKKHIRSKWKNKIFVLHCTLLL